MKIIITIIFLVLIPISLGGSSLCNDEYCLNVEEVLSTQQGSNDDYLLISSPQEESVFIGSNDDFILFVGVSTGYNEGGGGGGGVAGLEEEILEEPEECFKILYLCWWVWIIIILIIIIILLVSLKVRRNILLKFNK